MADGVSGISDVEPVAAFIGSGSRGPFPLTNGGASILYASADEIHGVRIDTEGEIQELTNGVHYTLTSTLDSTTGLYSGSVSLNADQDVLAAASGDTPAERLVFWREGALDQSFTLAFNTAFASQSFTALQNRIMLRLQELRAMIQRAPLAPVGDEAVELEDRLQRRGKVYGFDPDTGEGGAMLLAEAGDGTALMMGAFAFDGDGSTVEFRVANQHIPGEEAVLIWVGGSVQATDNYTVTIDGDDSLITFGSAPPAGTDNIVGRILGYRSAVAAEAEDNAAASATAAAASASAASSSATAAAASASAADSSASGIAAAVAAAEASASDAADSATTAATEATSAAASATAAAASQSAAAASQSAAASSQTAAASSASAAAASEAAAELAETNAETAEANAETAATAAAASASAAAASQSAAATSASNAATSASNAASSASAAAASETAAESAQTAAEAAQAAAEAAADTIEQAISGYTWAWDAGTSDADPGAGELRANNATLASVTMLYVSETDSLGASVPTAIDTWDDSTSTTRAFITLKKRSNPAVQAMFAVNGAITDGGSYRKVPVEYIAHTGAFSAADILGVVVERTGDAGPSGPGSGDLLAANALSELAGSASTARGNIAAAPNSADVLVRTANSELTAERVVTNTATVEVDWATAGQAKFQVVDASIGESKLANNAVTLAKMADIATDRLLGRDTTGTGDPEALTVGGGVEFTGAGGIQRSALTGDVTASAGSNATTIANNAVTTAKIADANVTLAKLANIGTDRLLGRDTASAGAPEELTVGGGVEFTGAGGIQRSALTGDVTASAGSNATTIANNAVTLAKMADLATDRLLGRDTTGTGDPEALTVGGGVEFTGAGGIQRSALTGDVTASAGSNATTIANNAVTNAKLRDSAAVSVIGRSANSAGDPADIAAAANDRVLARTGDALGFVQITVGMITDSIITFAKLASATVATAAEFWSNTASKLLSVAAVWSAADPVTITFSTTQTLDFSTFINGKITLTNNTTLQTPTNLKKGQSGCIELIQDATGGRTMNSTNAAFVWAGGTDGVLSTAANARDLLFYQILDDDKVFLSLVKAVA